MKKGDSQSVTGVLQVVSGAPLKSSFRDTALFGYDARPPSDFIEVGFIDDTHVRVRCYGSGDWGKNWTVNGVQVASYGGADIGKGGPYSGEKVFEVTGEEPPPTVTPPPGFPPFTGNPIWLPDWIKWLGQVINWAAEFLISKIAEALRPVVQVFWALLPQSWKDAIQAAQKFFEPWGRILSWFDKSAEDKAKDLNFVAFGLINDFVLKWLGLEIAPEAPYVRLVSPSLSKKPLLESLGIELGKAVGVSTPEQKKVILDAILATFGTTADDIYRDLEGAGKGLLEQITGPFEKALDQAKGLKGGLTEDQAVRIAGSLAAVGVSGFLLAWLVDQGVEIGTLGVSKATGKGIRGVLRTVGLAKITRSAVTAPWSLGVQPWLNRFYDEIFRTHVFERDLIDLMYLRDPKKRDLWLRHYRWFGFPDAYINDIEGNLRSYPSGVIADQMLFEGHISPETWRELYRKAGWRDQFIDAHLKTIPAEPREFLLARMLDAAPDFEPRIRAWLKQNGYFEPDLSDVISIFFRLAYRDEVKKLIDDAIKDFASGSTSASQLERALNDLDRPLAEVSFNVAVANQRKARDFRERQVKIFRGQFTRGALSREALEKKLQELGLQKDRITLELEEAALDIRDVQPKLFTESALRRLYLHNKIGAQEFLDRLIDAGWMEDDAALDVEDADIQRVQDERTRLATIAEKDLDLGRSDVAETRIRLRDLNYSPEETALRVARVQLEHAQGVTEELAKIHIKDFAEDVMTEKQFTEALANDGLKEWRIQEIVLIEKERKVPAEARGG